VSIHPLAGKPAPEEILIDCRRLSNGATTTGDPIRAIPAQLVSFGTSGHRGSPRRDVQRGPHPRDRPGDLRAPAGPGITGPLFMGKDSHALSGPPSARLSSPGRERSETVIQRAMGTLQPPRSPGRSSPTTGRTPISSPTGSWSRHPQSAPRTGASSYNPPHGGPADTDVTAGSRTGRTPSSAAGTGRCAASLTRPPSGRPRRTRTTWSCPT